jgi:hypothetical protein
MSNVNEEIERFARDLAANEGLRNEVRAYALTGRRLLWLR